MLSGHNPPAPVSSPAGIGDPSYKLESIFVVDTTFAHPECLGVALAKTDVSRDGEDGRVMLTTSRLNYETGSKFLNHFQ